MLPSEGVKSERSGVRSALSSRSEQRQPLTYDSSSCRLPVVQELTCVGHVLAVVVDQPAGDVCRAGRKGVLTVPVVHRRLALPVRVADRLERGGHGVVETLDLGQGRGTLLGGQPL